MSVRSRELLYASMTFLIVTLLVFIQMPHAFLNLSTMTFSQGGDGLKSYFTFLGHVKFDDSYLHFGLMNYPFGEHIIFTDDLPSVVLPVMWCIKHGLSLSQALGIFNGLILGSLLFTAPVVYCLNRHFGMSSNISLVVAIVLTLFSPQIWRIPAHEGLAHTIVVPFVWLLLLKFFEAPRIWITCTLGFMMTLLPGIHPYEGLIAFSLIASLWIFSFKSLPRQKIWHFLVQGPLPLLLFAIWSRVTDAVHDRVLPQTSAFYYRAYFESVFLPYEGSPFRVWIDKFLNLHRGLPIESIVYVGLVGFFALVFFIVRFAIRLYRDRRLIHVNPSLAAAILILLYSLGYPWRWIGEDLFRHLGPISQFRALGRFAWVFFWIYSVYVFQQICKLGRKWLITAAIILSAYEAYSWSHPIFSGIEQAAISPQSITMSPELGLLMSAVDIDRFQAFIPLPYFQAGSEGQIPTEVRERELPKSFADSVGLSYETGLPMVAQALSRTSVWQSKVIFDFMNGNSAEFIKQLPNSKPFLLVVGPEKKMSFEEALIARGHLLKRSSNYQLYELFL